MVADDHFAAHMFRHTTLVQGGCIKARASRSRAWVASAIRFEAIPAPITEMVVPEMICARLASVGEAAIAITDVEVIGHGGIPADCFRRTIALCG